MSLFSKIFIFKCQFLTFFMTNPDGGKFADHYLTIRISNQKHCIMPRVSCGK